MCRTEGVRRGRAWLGGGLVALVVVSCSGSHAALRTDPDRRATGSPSASGVSAAVADVVVPETPDPVRSAVEQAHRDAERAFELAAATADPTPALLEGTTAEPMLARRLAILQARRTNGWVAAWPSASQRRDEVVAYSLTGAGTAELEVCVVDDAVLSDRGTGEIVNDDVGVHRQRHEFALVSGVWKLVGRSTLASGDDSGCVR